MMQQEPEYVWEFGKERRRPGRVWLIVGLCVLAVAIATALFFLFFRPGAVSDPKPSASPTASTTPSETPTPTPTATPAPTATATSPATTAPTPPPPVDPGLADFRSRVAPVLDAARTGLGYAREEGGMAAMQDVMLVQQDAERLTESVAPSSIAQRWTDAVGVYAGALEALRAAYERGADAAAEDRAAVDALTELNSIVGR